MWNSPFIAKCSSLDFILLDKYIYGQSKGLEWHRLSTNSLTISWYCNSTVILCKDIINLLYFGIYWVDDVQMNWSCSRSSMHFPETLYIFHYIVRSIPFTTQLFCVIYMSTWPCDTGECISLSVKAGNLNLSKQILSLAKWLAGTHMRTGHCYDCHSLLVQRDHWMI